MKKLYACIVASALVSAVSAQTLTQGNHAPANGDMFSTQQCDSLNINPGASGAGALWNFGALTIHTSVTKNYTVVPSTTSGYPSNALSVASSANNQSYFVPSAVDLTYYGGDISAGTVAAKLTYSSPAIAAIYPMSLNTTSTAAIGGSINITSPTSLQGTFTGNSTTLADGSGTLTLPGGSAGTFTNVLRVVTSQTLNYTTSLVSGVVTQKSYDYYMQGIKPSLLTINTTTITSSLTSPSTQTLVTVNKDYLTLGPSTGIAKQNVAAGISVYPNPASAVVNFSTEQKEIKTVQIFDITGKLVEKQTLVDGSLKLDVSDYTKGLYLYSLLNQSDEVVKVGKLTVN